MKPQQFEIKLNLGLTNEEAKYVADLLMKTLFSEYYDNSGYDPLSYNLLDYYK